jgi:hypothetical protein
MSVVVGLSAMADGARHTRLLLRLRWRMVRTLRARLAITIGGAAVFGALFIASSVGTMLRRIAEQGQDTALTEFAVNYVLTVEQGEFGGVGALAFGSAVAASLFAPFTGGSNAALAPSDDLAGLRPPRLHRYFDSIVTMSASTIGIIQLLTLTAVGSLLTLDGGRVGGMLFTWSMWPLLLLASVAVAWALDLSQRALGRRSRRAIFAGLAAAVALALALDPAHGKTVFGLGTRFSDTLHAAGSGQVGTTAAGLAVVAVLSTAFIVVGASLCQAALALPCVPEGNTKEYRRRIPLSRHPRIVLFQILFAQVWRTGEARRAITTMTVVGIISAWFLGPSDRGSATLVIAIPLAVALAWGVNCFGILGTGMTWLAAQPHVMRRLLGATTLVQIMATLVVAILCWAPPILAGRVDGAQVATLAAGLAASTALTTRSALTKAVMRPFRARLGSSGDSLIPPLTAINYTLRFVLWSGQIGIVVLGQGGNRQIQIVLVAAILTWTTARYARLMWHWRQRSTQTRVVTVVSAA